MGGGARINRRCSGRSPRAHSSLERSQLTISETSRFLTLHTFEEFLGCSFWFCLKPAADGWPDCFKRIFAGSVIASWFCLAR